MTIINGDDGLQCVELRYESLRELQNELGPYLAGEGFFLKGETGLAPSDVLRFKIMLPGDFVLVEGVGVVIWTRTENECREGELPGTALGFATLSEQGRELIERMVQTQQERGGRPFDLTRPSSEAELPTPKIESRQKPKYEFQVRDDSKRPAKQAVTETSAPAREEELPFPEETPDQALPKSGSPLPGDSMPEPSLEEATTGKEDKGGRTVPSAPPSLDIGSDTDLESRQLTEEGDLLPAITEFPGEIERTPEGREHTSDETSAGAAKAAPAEIVEEEEQSPPNFAPEEPVSPSEMPSQEGNLTPERIQSQNIEMAPEAEPHTQEHHEEPPVWPPIAKSQPMDVVIMSEEDEEESESTLRVPSSPNLDVVIDDYGNIEVSSAQKTRRRGPFKSIGIIVLLAAIGGGGWWLWQNYSQTILEAIQGFTGEKTVEVAIPAAEEPPSGTRTDAGTETELKETEAETAAGTQTQKPGEHMSHQTQEPTPPSPKQEKNTPPEGVSPQGEASPAPPRTETEATPAPQAQGAATEVLDVAWRAEPQGTRVRIRANGILSTKRLGGGGLDNPPRYLLRINGIQAPFHPLEISVDSPELKAIRFGYHAETSPKSLWVVFDLRSSSVKMLKRNAEGQGVEILLGK